MAFKFNDDTPTVEEFINFARGRFKDTQDKGDSLSAYIDDPALVPMLAKRSKNGPQVYVAMAFRTPTQAQAEKFASDVFKICETARLNYLKCRIRKHDNQYWVMVFPKDRPDAPLVPRNQPPPVTDYKVSEMMMRISEENERLRVQLEKTTADAAETEKNLRHGLEAAKKAEQHWANRCAEASRLHANLQEELTGVIADAKKVAAENDVKSARIETLEREVNDLKQKIGKLQQELEALAVDAKSAAGENYIKAQRIQDLERELAATKKDLDESAQRYNEIAEQDDKLQRDLGETTAQVDKLKSLVDLKDKRIGEVVADAKAKTERIDELTREQDALTKSLETAAKKEYDLVQEITKLRAAAHDDDDEEHVAMPSPRAAATGDVQVTPTGKNARKRAQAAQRAANHHQGTTPNGTPNGK